MTRRWMAMTAGRVSYGCDACELSNDGRLWVCTEVCDLRDVHAYQSRQESDEARDDWIHENDMDAG